MDRDPGVAERRKVYGRAGEYRLPPHGLEYRTLGNFWLRAYPLMALVMGLTRIAVGVSYSSLISSKTYNPATQSYIIGPSKRDYAKELFDLVDMDRVVKAINTNDWDLAWGNFQLIKPFLAVELDSYTRTTSTVAYGLHSNLLGKFEIFVKKIKSDGLTHWFPTDPLTHWVTLPDGHGCGIENFLLDIKET